jgi:hypothetical protein
VHRVRGGGVVVVVAREDVDALDEDLAVVGDADADARQRCADGANLDLVGRTITPMPR